MRDRLRPDERQGLIDAFNPPRSYAPGKEIVAQGRSPPFSTAFLEGFAARIVGDFPDLLSFLLREMDHRVVALTVG